MPRGQIKRAETHKQRSQKLLARQPDQTLKAAMHGGFRSGWIAFQRQLTQGQKGVPEPQLGYVAQAQRKLLQPALALEPAYRLELRVRRAARADEIRLVGIGLT